MTPGCPTCLQSRSALRAEIERLTRELAIERRTVALAGEVGREAMAERDKWEARAIALFWSGSADDVTIEEVRKATDQYLEWKKATRLA